MSMLVLLRLFYEFAKVGLFAIGGGLATLPFLYDMAETIGWFTAVDVANMIAVSESTPGALGINMATYAGYITAGVPGGIAATLGLISPSIVIILIIARMLSKFKDAPLVQKALYGLRPASVALVAAAGVSVAEVTLVSLPSIREGAWGSAVVWPAVALGAVIFIAQRRFPKIHPVAFIVFAGVVGAVFRFPA